MTQRCTFQEIVDVVDETNPEFDNTASHDPRDYEEFDPAECLTPYPDDMRIDVCEFMARFA